MTPEIMALLMDSGMTPEQARDTNAVGLGNTIVVFGTARTMSTNTNGRVIDDYNANLLAHEAIHSLQAAAVGGLENFLNNYLSIARNGVPYLDIAYERAAYNFGPYNQDAIDAGSLSRPILDRNGNWFL
jgi:hypothetical protein